MNDHDANNSPQPAGKGKLIAALLVVIALAVVVIWYLATDQQSSSSTPPAPKVVEAPVAAPEAEEPQQELVADPADTVELGEQTPTETEPQPPEPVEPEPELPSLSTSTAAVVADLAAAEQPVEPLQSEQLIRDAVVFLDNIRNGVVVRDAAPVSGPKGRFRVLEQDDKIYIDPRSYDRYNTVVDWFVSLDVDTMTTLLDRYQPLVNEALAEIGYPDAQADRVVLDAIEVLMATPSVGTVIELNDDSVMYRYADPALEALSDAQKQMLRLGPDNMRRVKLKLEALQAALQDE